MNFIYVKASGNIQQRNSSTPNLAVKSPLGEHKFALVAHMHGVEKYNCFLSDQSDKIWLMRARNINLFGELKLLLDSDESD